MNAQYIVAFHSDGKEGMSGVERVNGRVVTFSAIEQAALRAGDLNHRCTDAASSAQPGVGKTLYEVRKDPTQANSLGEPLSAAESARVRMVYQQNFASQRRAASAKAAQIHKPA